MILTSIAKNEDVAVYFLQCFWICLLLLMVFKLTMLYFGQLECLILCSLCLSIIQSHSTLNNVHKCSVYITILRKIKEWLIIIDISLADMLQFMKLYSLIKMLPPEFSISHDEFWNRLEVVITRLFFAIWRVSEMTACHLICLPNHKWLLWYCSHSFIKCHISLTE